MGFSIGGRLRRWLGRPAKPTGETPLEAPLRPDEAAHKLRPGPEPPLEPGEAADKGRPGPEPPLEPGEAADKGRPGPETPLEPRGG